MISGRNDPPSRDPRTRTEPVLGDLDHLDTPPPPKEEAAPEWDDTGPPPFRNKAAPPAWRDEAPPSFSAADPQRARRSFSPSPRPHRTLEWIVGIVAAIIVFGGVWVWSHQDSLRADLPRTELNSLLARGDQALAQGKLSGSPDSARGLYEAARALDPDSEHALAGLRNVGNAQLARASDDVKQGKLDDARAALDEARGLLGGGAAVEAVESALARAGNHGASTDALVDRAQAALAAGRIDGGKGAAELFRRVLVADPGNAVARHGLDKVGDALATRVQEQLGRNDRAGAQHTLGRLAALLPNYAQLPALRASISEANRNADAARDQHLAQGETDLRVGKFTGTGDDNALAQFNAVLAVDPDNSRAHAGLGQVARALIVQANAAFDAGHPDDAKKLLDAAAGLAPKSADLAAARSRLKTPPVHADREVAEQDAAPLPQPVLSPAQSARVAELVQRAGVAAGNGKLMLPPGDSAYDLYRAALAIDGTNTQAQDGLHALPQDARGLFVQALGGGHLERAGDLLATLDQLAPGDPSQTAMQQQLGGAWIDRAAQLADQGRVDEARRALDEARRLTPGNPRIDEIDGRIGYGN